MSARGVLSPGQVRAEKFPVVGEKSPAAPPEGEWSLRVYGLAARPLTLSLAELFRLPPAQKTWDTICVTGWTHFAHRWRGVMLADVLALASPLPSARFVHFIAHSRREHDTSLPLDYALEHVLLANEVDGEPLAPEHGGPLRSVCEGRYFYKSVKWLKAIELLEEDRLGYWERESAYHNEADPWKEQRYVPVALSDDEFERRVRERDFSDAFAIVDPKFVRLRGLDLAGCDLRRARIKACDLSKLLLRGASAADANFTRSLFVDVDFRDADLSRCDLEGADLRGADLRGADLRGTALTATQFAHRWRPAKLEGARFLRRDIDEAGLGDADRAFLLDAANGALVE